MAARARPGRRCRVTTPGARHPPGGGRARLPRVRPLSPVPPLLADPGAAGIVAALADGIPALSLLPGAPTRAALDDAAIELAGTAAFVRIANPLAAPLTVPRVLFQLTLGDLPDGDPSLDAGPEDPVWHVLRARADGAGRLVVVVEQAGTLVPQALDFLHALTRTPGASPAVQLVLVDAQAPVTPLRNALPATAPAPDTPAPDTPVPVAQVPVAQAPVVQAPVVQAPVVPAPFVAPFATSLDIPAPAVPFPSGPSPATSPVPPPPARARRLLPVMLAVLVLLAGAGWVLIGPARRPPDPPLASATPPAPPSPGRAQVAAIPSPSLSLAPGAVPVPQATSAAPPAAPPLAMPASVNPSPADPAPAAATPADSTPAAPVPADTPLADPPGPPATSPDPAAPLEDPATARARLFREFNAFLNARGTSPRLSQTEREALFRDYLLRRQAPADRATEARGTEAQGAEAGLADARVVVLTPPGATAGDPQAQRVAALLRPLVAIVVVRPAVAPAPAPTVRYFHPADRAPAIALAHRLSGEDGDEWRVEERRTSRTQPPPGTLEAWLSRP